MRMHEAIRLGSLLGPQIQFMFYDGVGTCALGAAYLANGAYENCDDYTGKPYERLKSFTFEIESCVRSNNCPGCGHAWTGLLTPGSLIVSFDYRIDAMIVHLNDDHGWTREQIADWLEPIEEAYYASKECTNKEEEGLVLQKK